MRYFWLILGSLLATSQSGRGQINLVPNPSFETALGCPHRISQLVLAAPWRPIGPNREAADYFSACVGGSVGVPRNFAGAQRARTGQAYAGIFVHNPARPDYREFIQIRLIEPLRAHRVYDVSMYVSLGDRRTLAVEQLGMLFTDGQQRPDARTWRQYHPQVEATPGPLRDADGWYRVAGTYRAEGGETILTVGLFAPDARAHVHPLRRPRRRHHEKALAYYYIDDVSVRAQTPGFTELGLDATAPHPALPHIYFPADSFTVPQEYIPELAATLLLLRSDPTLTLRLLGHTDASDPGNTQHFELGYRRARAVKEYLVEHGIAANRLRVVSYGMLQPIADNLTPSGRRLNRRVSFEVVPPAF